MLLHPQTDTTYRIEGFSCANCAGKFERNVKELPGGVQDAKVNFGASKISVTGETTIAELEKAGAFENLKVSMDTPSYRSKAPSSDNSEGGKLKRKYHFTKNIAHFYTQAYLSYSVIYLNT